MIIFTDLLIHDFMICDKSSKLYWGADPAGARNLLDGWYPDGVYDLVLLLALIGINYFFKTKKKL